MRFNGTNEIKQLNGLERQILFKFVVSSIDESHLPFMSRNQRYFQTQCRYRSISVHPILSHSFPLEWQSRSCLHPSLIFLSEVNACQNTNYNAKKIYTTMH